MVDSVLKIDPLMYKIGNLNEQKTIRNFYKKELLPSKL